jgi:Holliday junction resolvase RusA-like endonuclease
MSSTPYDLSFFAPGVPAPKGSLDAVPVRGSRKVYMRAGNQTNQDRWASAIAQAAREAVLDCEPPTETLIEPYKGRVELIVQFVLPERPRVHAATDRGAGDLDKLQRCVWDALTGIVYDDDSQVTVSGASKRMAEPGEMGGATIHVRLLGTDDDAAGGA